MKLPNADRAEVDPRKLVEYCLSPTHEVGKHEAAVFEAVLGLTIVDAFVLRGLLMQAAIDGEASFVRSDEFGERHQLDFEVVRASRRAIVRSAWIVRTGEDFPRMTTCFVLPN